MLLSEAKKLKQNGYKLIEDYDAVTDHQLAKYKKSGIIDNGFYGIIFVIM